MVSTVVVAFGSLGAFIATFWVPEYALVGMLLGSSLGAYISVYESTVVGCLIGMLAGMLLAPVVFLAIDFETAYMVVFVSSLFGAFLGEPINSFWLEAQGLDKPRERLL